MEILSQNVRAKRKKLGWTVEKLANEAGLSWRGVQNVERGERWAQPNTIKRLANALSVHPSALFADPDNVPKPTPEEALEVLREAITTKSPGIPVKSENPRIPEDIIHALAALPPNHPRIQAVRAALGLEQQPPPPASPSRSSPKPAKAKK